MLSLICTFFVCNTPISFTHPCDMDIEHLSLENKIEHSIGCSKVGKSYVYKVDKLMEIVND